MWRYIAREQLDVVPLYFSLTCAPPSSATAALLVLDDDRIPLRAGETPEPRRVRFRTLGCWPLTAAVESDAG